MKIYLQLKIHNWPWYENPSLVCSYELFVLIPYKYDYTNELPNHDLFNHWKHISPEYSINGRDEAHKFNFNCRQKNRVYKWSIMNKQKKFNVTEWNLKFLHRCSLYDNQIFWERCHNNYTQCKCKKSWLTFLFICILDSSTNCITNHGPHIAYIILIIFMWCYISPLL